jgi:predicted O-methyltransferase YrrM
MKKWTLSCMAVGLAAWTGYVALAQPAGPPRRRRPAPAGEVKTEIQAKDASEKKILDVLDDLDKNQRRGMMNVPVQDGRLLRLLAESINAKHVVEIGTSNGYSGIWICLALRKTGGKLTTHEIDEGRAKLARENFKRAGVEKMVTLVFGDAHKEVTKIKDPIDMVFLDADKAGYVDYLKKLLPLVKPGGLIVGHNVRSQAGSMKPFLDAIKTDKNLETMFFHMYGTGVSVTMKKR